MSENTSKKRKLSLPLVLAGSVSSLVLALGMSPTFSAFTASILNPTNTAGSGTLIMTETDSGTNICNSADATSLATNSASCSTNLYGANLSMIPGQPVNTTVNIRNTGTVNATGFSLAGGACVQSANGNTATTPTDMCSKIKVVIMSGTHEIFNGTAATLAATAVTPIDVNGKLVVPSIVAQDPATPFIFTVTLDDTVSNAYQGLKVSQPITWTFQS